MLRRDHWQKFSRRFTNSIIFNWKYIISAKNFREFARKIITSYRKFVSVPPPENFSAYASVGEQAYKKYLIDENWKGAGINYQVQYGSLFWLNKQ